MEFTIPAPLGAQASLLANMPVRKMPDSTKVEAAPNAGKARADMHNSARHGADQSRQSEVTPRPSDLPVDPETLAGPPPSFQLNVLELDQKLQQQLARLETHRAHAQQTEGPDTPQTGDQKPEPSRLSENMTSNDA
ncbi:hypothetical protein MUY21_02475 [Aliiroseovarius sp. S2029]|uniref:hypothetical protein n=1 Tax=Aliiroseovarius sp. S2029 TaxID=2936988 RepID=UPI0020BED86D|nr:hypothetical protein [Aliiroseovarius sp. S2029]MCK8482891.1 hypothetical protein [Aliiroseovarius sp. S2029]